MVIITRACDRDHGFGYTRKIRYYYRFGYCAQYYRTLARACLLHRRGSLRRRGGDCRLTGKIGGRFERDRVVSGGWVPEKRDRGTAGSLGKITIANTRVRKIGAHYIFSPVYRGTFGPCGEGGGGARKTLPPLIGLNETY